MPNLEEIPATFGGEQPLPPYSSCNLGSINLANFVSNPYTEYASVDWERLRRVSKIATQFLDQVIDVNKYPIEKIEEKSKKDRRIGLGVMGWAEMLVQLMIPYDSEEARLMAAHVMEDIKLSSSITSHELAKKRGAYPEWKGSMWHHESPQQLMRNATLTTVAPTGTISMLAAKPSMPCSGGIEPKFALAFVRNQAGLTYLDIDGQFENIAKLEGWYSDNLMKRIAENGSCKGLDEVPQKWRNIFVTANEISPEAHVLMQAAFQNGCSNKRRKCFGTPIDAAVSKTINFSNTATIDDVENSYILAWKSGLKGITVYRDGSRQGQVLTAGSEQKNEIKDKDNASVQNELPTMTNTTPIASARPMQANGRCFVIPTHFGNMTLDVHMDDNWQPFEVMVNVGATGSDLMADAVGMGMLVSTLLRLRSDVKVFDRINLIIEKLGGIGGSGTYGFGPNRVTSLASAIAKGLEKFIEWHKSRENESKSISYLALTQENREKIDEMVNEVIERENLEHLREEKELDHKLDHKKCDLCPECKNYTYVYGSGCGSCRNCGYSACK